MDQPIIDPGKVHALIAGGLGAFLSILFQRSTNKLTMLTTLTAAEFMDYYFASPVWEALHARYNWIDTKWQGPIAFTTGLFAVFVVGGAMKMAQDFFSSPWKAFGDFAVSVIRRLLPGKER